MCRIKLLLVLGDKLAKRGLRSALEAYEDIQITGEAGDAVQAIKQVTAANPDVIVMDASISYINGLKATRILREQGFPGAVVILSTDAMHLEEAVDSGATGYLLSYASDDELVAIIRRALDGRFVFGGSVMNTAQGLETASRHIANQLVGNERLQPPSPALAATSKKSTADCAAVEALSDAPFGDGEITVDAIEEQLPTVDQSTKVIPTSALEFQDVAELIVTPQSPTWDTLLREVELVISHPAPLTKVLELHQWLQEVSNAVINEMAGSPAGDTVLRASLGRPVPLMRLLSELPDVANVTEEPYVWRRPYAPLGFRHIASAIGVR